MGIQQWHRMRYTELLAPTVPEKRKFGPETRVAASDINCLPDSENLNVVFLAWQWRVFQVFLLGTMHISESSAEEVRKVIRQVKPDNVMVELCPYRGFAVRRRAMEISQGAVHPCKMFEVRIILSAFMHYK